MYFTHRKVFANDPNKRVYTVVVGETVVGKVCGEKGAWSVLGPAGVGPEVHPTREAAGASLVVPGAQQVMERLSKGAREVEIGRLEKSVWVRLANRADTILWSYDQPRRVYPPENSMHSIDRAAQWSAQLTRGAVGMVAELLYVLQESGVLTKEQVEKITAL